MVDAFCHGSLDARVLGIGLEGHEAPYLHAGNKDVTILSVSLGCLFFFFFFLFSSSFFFFFFLILLAFEESVYVWPIEECRARHHCRFLDADHMGSLFFLSFLIHSVLDRTRLCAMVARVGDAYLIG